METRMISASLPWNDGTESHGGDQYNELAAEIVLQAVKDYVSIIRQLWKRDLTMKEKRKLIVEKMDLEEFFHSGWFGVLTDIDPDSLMQNCRIRAIEKEKEEIKRQNLKRIKELQKAAESEET